MPVIELSDVNDRRLRPYSGMTDGQLKRGEGFRRDNPQGLFIGESGRVIERALDAGIRPVSVLADDRWLAHDGEVVDRIMREWPDAAVFKATPQQFRDITGYQVVRGALACFERPKPLTLDDILDSTHVGQHDETLNGNRMEHGGRLVPTDEGESTVPQPGESLVASSGMLAAPLEVRRIVILEDVTNYANMGAIFRSAAALGWDAVLVTPSCHNPFYRRCARVSMGAVFQVPWARVGSSDAKHAWAQEVMPRLRQAGFVSVALALRDDSLDLRAPQLANANRLAIVLGTEGDGLRDSTISACDHTVRIPMHHEVDSLNVAACAAITLWELASRE